MLLKQDIILNRSIKDALVAEEKFFRSRPVFCSFAFVKIRGFYRVFALSLIEYGHHVGL